MLAMMKKQTSLLLAALLAFGGIFGVFGFGAETVQAEPAMDGSDQVWGAIGIPDEIAQGGYPSIATYNGTLYLLYQDRESDQLNLMRYKNNNWEAVGEAVVTGGGVNLPRLNFDGSGTPYVTYTDDDRKATMWIYDGSSWGTFGVPAFTAGAASDLSVTVTTYGTPYVAYRDSNEDDKATVMYNYEDEWVTLGTPGFSSGSIRGISIDTNTSGIPYVAYGQSDNKTYVRNYPIFGWSSLPEIEQSEGATLVVDGDTVYIAYKDGSAGYRVTVMVLNDGNWEPVGEPAFSSEEAFDISLAFDQGKPYVAFKDGNSNENDEKITVMMYDGDEWVVVGNAGFSIGVVYGLSFAVDEGIPYVAYQDGNERLRVMSLFKGSPSLTADTTDTDTDHDIEITFDDDPAWRLAHLAVHADNVPLTEGTDYILSEGKLTITAGALAPSIAEITVAAEGYSLAKVHQIVSDTTREWQSIGEFESFGLGTNIDSLSLVIDDGIPYVAYRDEDRKATVMKFVEDEWALVGDAGFSAEGIFNIELYVDNGIPYAAYYEPVDSYVNALSVMTYDGDSWNPIGESSVYQESYAGGHIALTVVDGIPYVAYNSNGLLVIKKYSNDSWETVIELPDFYTQIGTLAVVGNTLYVGTRESNGTNRVIKYDGMDGEPLGGIQPFEHSTDVAFAIEDGIPYAAVADNRLGGKLNVLAYDVTLNQWLLVGGANLSENIPDVVNIVVDHGIPYVAFMDGGETGKPVILRAVSTISELSGLSVSTGALGEVFDPSTTSYTAAAASNTSSMTVTPTAQDGDKATITVNEVPVASGQASDSISLAEGVNTIVVKVVAQSGASKVYTIEVTRASDDASGGDEDGGNDNGNGGGVGGGGGSTNNGGTVPATEDQNETGTGDSLTLRPEVSVEWTEQGGQSILTVTVDEDSLIEQAGRAGDGPVVSIPVEDTADKVSLALGGEVLRALGSRNAVLDIRTPNGSYKLPANEVFNDQLLAQLGAGADLANMTVQVDIARSDTSNMVLLTNAADQGGLQVLSLPVDFVITATFGDQSVQITRFNTFVEREIPLPQDADVAGSTVTAVVLEEEGTIRTVPTKLVTRNGVTYAIVNSLTNSTYSVVSNPVGFQDVEQHWAKDVVNEMGARMIVSGTGSGLFSPDQAITRAEFTSMIVRSLGLSLRGEGSVFADVKASDWYGGAVQVAHANQWIGGFEDGTFRPNDKITREQAMVIISRAMEITGLRDKGQRPESALLDYSDSAEISAWAFSGVADSVRAGIVSGRGNDTLAPKAFMTRAEVAVILQRMLRNAGLI